MFKWLHRIKCVISGEDYIEPSKKVQQVDVLAGAETLRQCIRIYVNTETGSVLEGKTIDKISKLARSLDDWITVHNEVSQDSRLGQKALEKIKETAKSFSDWSRVLCLDAADASLKSHATAKMSETAKTFEEWATVLSRSSESEPASGIAAKAEAELIRLSVAFDQWLSLYSKEGAGEAFKLVALKKAIESAKSLDELVRVYREIPDGDESETSVLSAIKAFEADFEDWKRTYDEDVSEALASLALEKMAVTAGTFSQWTDVCDYAESREMFEVLDKATVEISKIDASFSEWKELFERADEDSPFELTIATKAIAAAGDLDDLVELHKAAAGSSKAEKLVFEALQGREGESRDSWKSVCEDDEATEELAELAFAKVAAASRGLDDVFDLCELLNDDDERIKAAAAAFNRLGLSRGKVIECLKDGSCPQALSLHAFESAFCLSVSVFELVELSLVIRDEDNEDMDCPDDLERRVAEKAVRIATHSELRLLALLAEDGSELHDAAQKAVRA
ncbi:MAG: hypothetical protein HZA81_02860 [Candidatus Taylorbacteria bacterium]|nr:hypothetical protein [Candidatus Taylorbacteria bacterium]